MKWFLKNHLPDNLEILFMLVLGILLQMVDGSPFTLKERWMLVWATELPKEFFSPFVQKFIKALLSMIVAVRCSTTYAYIASAMLVIFCIVGNTTPKLMLPWLLISAVKSVSMNFLEALAGVYVCSAFGKIRKACIEFFISKALEIILATYLWGNVLNLYQEMQRKAEQLLLQAKEHMFSHRGDFGRQRTRSLVDESTLYKTACLNNFEFKDVPQIILQMLGDDEMSQDSLLAPGMMLASVSNLGSCDDLKTSESLGELGFMDLGNTQIIGLEEDDNLSPQEKALKFLKLTKSDVNRIQVNKSFIDSDIFKIDEKTWKSVMASGTHLNKPKQARAQVFIRDISQQEGGEESSRGKVRKRSLDFNFGFTFSNLFFNKSPSFDEEEEEEDEILTLSQEEDDEGKEEEDEGVEMFMSNINESAVVHRNTLGFLKIKGNAYRQLYNQDFMSVIGPEVFDRATKLPKVTSLTRVIRKSDARTSASLPQVRKSFHRKKLSFEDFKQKKRSLTPEEQSEEPSDESSTPVEEKIREKKEEIQEVESNLEKDFVEKKAVTEYLSPLDSTPKEHPSEMDPNGTTSEDYDQLKVRFKTSHPLVKSLEETSSLETEGSISEDCECLRPKPLRIQIKKKILIPSLEAKPKPYRRRRIAIRRIKKKRKITKVPESQPTDSNYPSKTFVELKRAKDADREKGPKQEESEESSNSESSNSSRKSSRRDDEKYSNFNVKQIYFLTELLRKPFVDVLLTYYDLKKRVHVQRKVSWIRKLQEDMISKVLQMHENDSEERIWKSKVFKTAELYTRLNNPLRSFLSSMKRESILRKLIYYEILQNRRRNLERFTSRDWNWQNFSDVTSDVSITSKSHLNLKSTPERDNSSRRSIVSFEKLEKAGEEAEARENLAGKPSEVLGSEGGESLCSQESDEPISLYYSKAANLASPLLDMKRFIYPDHIHYSYKHVKKKGFDVDINGGFPLLVRESLMTPVKVGTESKSTPPEFEITRRPMDLSFATTNAFAEWQNNDQNDAEVSGKEFNEDSSEVDLGKSRKPIKVKRPKKKNNDKNESRSSFKNDGKHLYSAKDYDLIEKLVKMHLRLNGNDNNGRQNDHSRRSPVQISSTQLHSNKGRINSMYNPAIFLQKNKSRNEKKKIETQEKRTKDMFARLEREVLLQSKNVQKTFGSSRRLENNLTGNAEENGGVSRRLKKTLPD